MLMYVYNLGTYDSHNHYYQEYDFLQNVYNILLLIIPII